MQPRLAARLGLTAWCALAAASIAPRILHAAVAPPAAEAPPLNAPSEAMLAAQLASAHGLMAMGHPEKARPILAGLAEREWACRDLVLLLRGRCELAMGDAASALATARAVAASVPLSVRGADADWLAADALKAAHS